MPLSCKDAEAVELGWESFLFSLLPSLLFLLSPPPPWHEASLSYLASPPSSPYFSEGLCEIRCRVVHPLHVPHELKRGVRIRRGLSQVFHGGDRVEARSAVFLGLARCLRTEGVELHCSGEDSAHAGAEDRGERGQGPRPPAEKEGGGGEAARRRG